MNPSSLDIFFSAVQRQKDMVKYFRSILVDDEARRTSFNNNYRVRQQVTCSLNDIYIKLYQVVK
jgi:hypothetical protein